MLFIALFVIEFLVFFLVRCVFLLWHWSELKAVNLDGIGDAFLVGFRVDMTTIALLSLPAFLMWLACADYSRFRKFSVSGHLWPYVSPWKVYLVALGFLLFEIPALIFSAGDSEFVNFTGRRFAYDSLFYLKEGSGKWGSIIAGQWFLSLITFAIVLLNLFLVFKIVRRKWKKTKPQYVVVVLLLLFVAARGGWQKKPLGFSQTQIFQKPMLNHLALNSGFTILETIKKDSVQNFHFFNVEDQWLKYLPASESGESAMENHRFWLAENHKQNVVLVIVESLSLQYMGAPFNDKGYTPFIDELSKKGIFFRNNYANARRSIEGIGAILAGIPHLMNEPFLSSPYTATEFLRIGSYMHDHGYHTSFFHGGHNGTMYFDSFMQALGIEKYFGANEYHNPSDDDGTWGIFDGPFLQRMKIELDNEKSPFFTSVFTLSSHPPFTVPDSAKGKFPKGDSEIFESMGYADQSLREFFQASEKSSWYKDTLFIVTGDHTYKGSRSEFANEIGDHRVPLIFFHPRWLAEPETKPMVDPLQVTSQIDILPSVLDFLGVQEYRTNFLGRSVFRKGERWAVFFENDKFHLMQRESFATYQASRGFNLFAIDDVKELSPEKPENDSLLVLRMKAFLQYFSEGLLQNRWLRSEKGS